jgi:glycyl-tRNA synthetase beta chain
MTLTTSSPLLIELLTEELPPKALRQLGAAFAGAISERLIRDQLCNSDAEVIAFASPRRLAVLIPQVRNEAPEYERVEKLLPLAIALDGAGQPTAPLIKKLAGLGLRIGENITLADLEHSQEGKQPSLLYRCKARGAQLADSAQTALSAALDHLPIPKVMNYQRPDGQTVRFVRPAHGLLAMHGERVLPLTALGLQAGDSTLGHRFHSSAPIRIRSPLQYADQLKEEGHVLASFEQRRAFIRQSIESAAQPDHPVMPEALLDEVTSLVEWPVVLEGHFEQEFLAVPQECLILTMQQNQKYFALTNQSGKLINRFLLVSNIASRDPGVVVSGNERVLRARLADAKFFFDQDRRKPLLTRVDGLTSVVYHNRIGTQRERIDRIAHLATTWSGQMGVSADNARRAAMLAKADLLTDMVGEFPELQGVIGTYYARHDGEPEDVAGAIAGHYHPRFSGDTLPETPLGMLLALADKLETIVGIWGLGQAPTGDKDPFALRRHALGVIRIIIDGKLALDLDTLLADTAAAFAGIDAVRPDLPAIRSFIIDRIRGWLREKGHSPEAIDAVLCMCPGRIADIPDRLAALDIFMEQPQAQSLCAANKRIGNLLRKSDASVTDITQSLLKEAAEIRLADTIAVVAPAVAQAFAAGRYAEALNALADLKEPVDTFFDEVMVLADDPAIRANRLALLASLHRSMNQIADLSRLATG